MSMQDPIADLLTHIRNGHAAKKSSVKLPFSKMKLAIANVLLKEGYIEDCRIIDETAAKKKLEVVLKYFNGKPVISTIDRVSRPGLRIYKDKNGMPKVLGGLGIAIVSTTKGVMSDRQARQLGQGGEVLCTVT
ncbi:MAG TPA: 30S ribosomal protein S8 [Gammaproteobacteria bacterium]|nr:30S ribosomal protein S8 [Gammaproteobacteria bacterium]